MPTLPHITVCVCTFRRPQYLKRLLPKLCGQQTLGLFSYSIVVADNDHERSAESAVSALAAGLCVPVLYCVEPRQNIALARNKAVESAQGEFVAFIDDDELPANNWLLTLYDAHNHYHVDGVLGSVRPLFDAEAPDWVVNGKFYERATYKTGLVIDWRKGRTNNVLLDKRLFQGETSRFRAEFLTGEDQDWFRRAIEDGHRFIWCNEAVVYEAIPPERWKRSFMLKRALLRGAISRIHPTCGFVDIAKSVIAVPVYTAALPFALVAGQHRFMTILVRLFDHMGKLLAVLGIQPIKAYVT